MFNLAILRRKKRNILDRNDSKNEMYQSPKIMAVQIIKNGIWKRVGNGRWKLAMRS